MSAPVSELGLVKPGSVWDRIRSDDRLTNALRVLSLRDISIIAQHAKAGSSADTFSKDEVDRLIRAEMERCIMAVAEQRCERGTTWDLAIVTAMNAIKPGSAVWAEADGNRSAVAQRQSTSRLGPMDRGFDSSARHHQIEGTKE